MILGIDIDDTITETTKVSNGYLAKYDNNYQDYHDLPQEKYNEFINLYLQEIVKNNILKDGVKEAFLYFKSIGCKIVFITARNDVYTPNVKKLSKEFLDNNHIPYDKIVFDDVAIGDKSKYAYEEKIDIFIDDKEMVLDRIKEVNPQIECLRFTKDKSKYKTFDNWNDLQKYIKNKIGG